MAQHAQRRIDTGLQVFFCDPRSPWQRGTNENTNGLLRQYFPKGTNLNRHSASDIAAVATTLNRRPRKTLGWRTPSEAFNELLLSQQRGRVAEPDPERRPRVRISRNAKTMSTPAIHRQLLKTETAKSESWGPGLGHPRLGHRPPAGIPRVGTFPPRRPTARRTRPGTAAVVAAARGSRTGARGRGRGIVGRHDQYLASRPDARKYFTKRKGDGRNRVGKRASIGRCDGETPARSGEKWRARQDSNLRPSA